MLSRCQHIEGNYISIQVVSSFGSKLELGGDESHEGVVDTAFSFIVEKFVNSAGFDGYRSASRAREVGADLWEANMKPDAFCTVMTEAEIIEVPNTTNLHLDSHPRKDFIPLPAVVGTQARAS